MLLHLFRKRRQRKQAAENLYRIVVARARAPVFYTELGAVDTPEGRFEMVALHLFVVLRRLQRAAAGGDREAARVGQALFDETFADMDRNLRELGVGDLGVGPRIKKMAKGFYGRVAAYEKGLAQGDERLITALRRNLYGGEAAEEDCAAMAAYLRSLSDEMERFDASTLIAGDLRFAALPAPGGDRTVA